MWSFIDKFIIFVEIPTISNKTKIIARCGKIYKITKGAKLTLLYIFKTILLLYCILNSNILNIFISL